MRSNKPYTNATFTKRVDHEAGRHRPTRALAEPVICEQCGAIYSKRRWSISHSESMPASFKNPSLSHLILCPGCAQKNSGEPRGFLFLDGTFLGGHYKQIERLLRNEAERAAEDNPLACIMEWKRGGVHDLTVTTTTEHLAQRLGNTLEKAFGGSITYDFSHENKLARVNWRRG
jgi:hypothetical protein